LAELERKGIILSGGTGTRLYPITRAICKQLVPLFDKPMIYYPLSTLMLSGIKQILIITTEVDRDVFQNLLGDGSQFGISIEYAIQHSPEGIAQAFLIAKNFLGDSPAALILGDNLFHGDGLIDKLRRCNMKKNGASIIACSVKAPERYAVVDFDSTHKVVNLEEKPIKPKSQFAVTGLYFYDNTVCDRAKGLKPSKRGELEITDLNNLYLKDNQLYIEGMGRGMVWLDTGTFDSLHEASTYIRTIEHRQDLKVGCPEEVAWRLGYISNEQLEKLATSTIKSGYGLYLLKILEEHQYLHV